MAASGLFDDELELGWADSNLDVAKWFDETMNTVVSASGGTLTASYTDSTAAYNVSTQTVGGLAVADWKVFTAVSTQEQKSGATLISDYSVIGSPDLRFDGGATQGTVASWTSDGTPTASGSNAAGFRQQNFDATDNGGVSGTLAINTSVRKARIYIGRFSNTAGASRFSGTFTLSDGSASPVTVNLAGIASDTDGYFDLSFSAGSAGQTLLFEIRNNAIGVSETRAVNLRAVWLSVEDAGAGVTGVATSSQAQTSTATGSHTIASVSGNAISSQAQTTAATGSHAPLAVTSTASSSQAQTSVASGSHTIAAVTGTATSSQAQTSSASGSFTIASVSGTSDSSQAQTTSATGSHTVAGVTGTATSSQAQTSAANGAFSTGISSAGTSSQAQTTSVAGSHTIASVTGNVTSAQAQTTVATGSHTVAGVTGSASSSQAQTTSATGSQTIGVNGVGTFSQAQTTASTGSFAIQPVGGVASSSQAQTTAGLGNGGGVDAPVVVGGIDLFETQRRNRRKAKPDNELTEQEAEIKALMQIVIKSKKTAKSRQAAQLFAIQPLELPKVEIAPKPKSKKTPKTVILDVNYISDDDIEIILALMLEMM